MATLDKFLVGQLLLYILEPQVGFLAVMKWMNCGDTDLISLHPKFPGADSRPPAGSATKPGSSPEDPVCVQPCHPPRGTGDVRGPWAKDAGHAVSTEVKS